MYENIHNHKEAIITKALEQIDPMHHEKSESYIVKSRRDIRYTIDFTLESIAIKQKSILINYYKWLIETLDKYQIKQEPLFQMFDVLKVVLKDYLEKEDMGFLNGITHEEIRAVLVQEEPSNVLTIEEKRYLNLLLQKDRKKAYAFILELVNKGFAIENIYIDVLQKAMVEIGRLWQYRKINVADEHMATVITQYVMTGLYPYIFETKKHGKRMVALALGDELHEIGIRMVADLFEYYGFETHYLGANMPIESILEYCHNYQPHLLAASVTLGNHLSELKTLIKAIHEDPSLHEVKILIGGQAVARIPNAVKVFEADGFAFDGISAVKVGEELVGI